MKDQKILAKFEDPYSKGFVKTNDWLDILYADVTQQPATAGHYRNHGHLGEKAGS